MGKGTGSGDRGALTLNTSNFRGESPEMRAVASVVGLSCGDALGFPTETVRQTWRLKKRFGLEYVTEYIDHQYANKGEYSDDTQQTLMVARCIRPDGTFDVERWATQELPYWWEYQRGAGYTSAVAVKNLTEGAAWDNNFFREETLDRHGNPRLIDYRLADSNGTVMRVAPLAIANRGNLELLKTNVWLSAVTSHGHPGAALAAETHAYVVANLLNNPEIPTDSLVALARDYVENASIPTDECFDAWKERWNSEPSAQNMLDAASMQESNTPLEQAYERGRAELLRGLDMVDGVTAKTLDDVMEELNIIYAPDKTRAIPAWLGGLATVVAHQGDGGAAIIDATNRLGSDTDTLAAVSGTICGARDGGASRPTSWDEVQDGRYTAQIGFELAAIANGTATQSPGVVTTDASLPDIREAILGGTADEVTKVNHPLLGVGEVLRTKERTLPGQTEGHTLVTVQFDCGQTCRFRSDGFIGA
jgi:ADP-ribosylglycohydrolase